MIATYFADSMIENGKYFGVIKAKLNGKPQGEIVLKHAPFGHREDAIEFAKTVANNRLFKGVA